MGNLIRMDLYRMNKAKSFRVCLILTFAFALASTPLEKLLYDLGKMLSAQNTGALPETKDLCGMIANPLSSVMIMLALLSVVFFYYADMEGGYIKNIAGQMPRRGFSILSRFIAAVPHSLAFMLAGLAGSLIGSIPFQRIVLEGSLPEAIASFLLRLLLLQSVCAVLLLFAASLRNKSLGLVLAVLFGLPVMALIYAGINTGLQQIFGKGIDMIPYMPDQVLKETSPDALRAFLVSAVTIGIFLPLSVRVFDKKDIK